MLVVVHVAASVWSDQVVGSASLTLSQFINLAIPPSPPSTSSMYTARRLSWVAMMNWTCLSCLKWWQAATLWRIPSHRHRKREACCRTALHHIGWRFSRSIPLSTPHTIWLFTLQSQLYEWWSGSWSPWIQGQRDEAGTGVVADPGCHAVCHELSSWVQMTSVSTHVYVFIFACQIENVCTRWALNKYTITHYTCRASELHLMGRTSERYNTRESPIVTILLPLRLT